MTDQHWSNLTDFDERSYMVAQCRSGDFQDKGLGADECRRVARAASKHHADSRHKHDVRITLDRWHKEAAR